MHKKGATALALLLLAACSHNSVGVGGKFPYEDSGKLKDEARPISPEEDPKAPGMIPQECETLLNKSQEWGYKPNAGNWKPASPAQALEALTFFSTFHLVPVSTSNFARAWLEESPPSSEAGAQASLDRMERAQSCDLLLSHQLLLALVSYRWPAQEKKEVSRLLLKFVLNQQTRVAPSLARAVHLDILSKSVAKGFIRANHAEVKKIQRWFDVETAKGMKRAEDLKTSRDEWTLHRDEVRVSEEARERMGRLLPLPD